MVPLIQWCPPPLICDFLLVCYMFAVMSTLYAVIVYAYSFCCHCPARTMAPPSSAGESVGRPSGQLAEPARNASLNNRHENNST